MAQHYSVFLSYRHKPFDEAATRRAFNALEAYRLPAALRREGYKGVERVFRDTEELPVSRMLTSTIQTAISNSDCLVVVCSPDTPSSEWVDREVATFIELGRAERVFPLLIAGEPENAFPPSLKKIPDVWERVMDLRGHAEKISARRPGELLKVISAVAGCQYARLLRAERMRRAGMGLRRSVLDVAVALLLCVIAGAYWLQAENYREEAQLQQERSMETLSYMTYDLPNKLVELPSTYEAVAQILKENAAEIDGILELARDQSGIREQIGANCEKYATATARLGRYGEAEASQLEAIAVYEELLAQGESGAQSLLASARNNLGVIYNTQGKYSQAAEEYTAAAELLREVYRGETGLAANLAVFLSNGGANAMDMGDYAAAAPAFRESAELLTALDGGSGAYASQLARAGYNLGVCLMSTGDYAEAEEQLRSATESYAALYEASPNRSALKPYAQSITQLALCLSRQAKLAEAEDIFPDAIAMLEELSSGGDDAAASSLLATACNNYGLCLNMDGDYAAAAPWYLRYAELMEGLYASTGTDLDRAYMARAYYNVAENAYKLGDYAVTREYFGMCLREYEPVSAALGSYHRAEYLARLCYYDIIVTHDYAGAAAAADEAIELQPDSSFVRVNRVYALLFAGRYEECDALALETAAMSPGEKLNMELDFAAMKAAGLNEGHMDALIELLNKAE